ncbi:MAG: tetratricopeptide repeat protein [Gemmatimonadota bacterium]
MNVGPSDLRRWSEEVARDPGSPAFVALAEAYRRQGRREAAFQVCLRGLERNPDHVDAHALLARLYLEAGERARAADEWGIVLRLEPESFEANRGLGFYRLERGELDAARRHLQRAIETQPDDPTVREALAVLDERGEAESAGEGAPGVAVPESDGAEGALESAGAGGRPERRAPDPPSGADSGSPASVADSRTDESDAAGRDVERGSDGSASGAEASRDPVTLFAELQEEAPFRGAVLVRRDGLALAGRLEAGGTDRAEAIGAVLGEAIEEAVRAADVLELGEWRGVAFDAAEARVHILGLADGHAVVIAAAPDAPAGWMIRVAERARALADAFLRRDG